MKKVVVVYPCPHLVTEASVGIAVGGGTSQIVYVSEKTFEGKSLEVLNKPNGCLIVKEVNGHTYAVFKHWIYWENIK